MTIDRRERLVGREVWVLGTGPLRSGAAAEKVLCLVGKPADLNIEQRKVDELPFPGLLAMV